MLGRQFLRISLLSTNGSFKRDISGSDKRYSFRVLTDSNSSSVHLFESAVDLLSYATLLKCDVKSYQTENLLSLSGVYQPRENCCLQRNSRRNISGYAAEAMTSDICTI